MLLGRNKEVGQEAGRRSGTWLLRGWQQARAHLPRL